MQKVIIINGKGGVGKDTLCELAAKHFRVQNFSSIDPIKKIATENGWNGEKDAKSRKFLSDLKRIFSEYNDLPNEYLYQKYLAFQQSDDEILFVHIREKEEIKRFQNRVGSSCITLLVTRNQLRDNVWGNASDDEVETYHYDYYFDNSGALTESEESFVHLLKQIIS